MKNRTNRRKKSDKTPSLWVKCGRRLYRRVPVALGSNPGDGYPTKKNDPNCFSRGYLLSNACYQLQAGSPHHLLDVGHFFFNVWEFRDNVAPLRLKPCFYLVHVEVQIKLDIRNYCTQKRNLLL